MSNSVPDGWSETNINNVCNVLDSKRIPLNSQKRATRQGVYPYYGANGIQGFINDYIFEGEYVLLAEDGGNFDQWEDRPISYFVSGKFWVNNHAHILKAKGDNITRFIHYSLVHKNILKHINGGTRAKLNQSDMRDIELLRPPLPEQKKIAAILTSVDTVIEKTQAQIDKLKDLKTGMMQELLTKGIGHTEFKDSPVGRIPVEWDCVKMNTIAKVTDGAHHTPNYTPTGVPFLRVTDLKNKNIFDGNIKYIHQSEHIELLKRCKPEKGDILYSKNGTIGITRLIDWEEEFSIFVSLALIKRLSEQISSEYLVLFMDSPIIHEQIRTRSKQGTVTNLHLEEIRDFDIPVPEQKEQLKISQVLNSLVVRLKLAEEKLLIHKNTKKALMQDLLTGKVRLKV